MTGMSSDTTAVPSCSSLESGATPASSRACGNGGSGYREFSQSSRSSGKSKTITPVGLQFIS